MYFAIMYHTSYYRFWTPVYERKEWLNLTEFLVNFRAHGLSLVLPPVLDFSPERHWRCPERLASGMSPQCGLVTMWNRVDLQRFVSR